MIGIYKITNPDGKIYIGQSSDLMNRIKGYRLNLGSNKAIKESFNFFGYDSHKFEIVEECELGDLLVREKYYINLLNPILNGSPGQPKKDNPKIRVTFRLEPKVIEIIKTQENQAKFIERLVLEFDKNK